MVKTKAFKSTYKTLKGTFTPNIAVEKLENDYMQEMMEETIKELLSGKMKFYTEEEFWKIRVEREIEMYGKPISDHIYRKYAKRLG